MWIRGHGKFHENEEFQVCVQKFGQIPPSTSGTGQTTTNLLDQKKKHTDFRKLSRQKQIQLDLCEHIYCPKEFP